MPIEVRWHNAHLTIILMNIEAGSAWNEFDDAVEETVKLAKAVSHPVYVVLQPNNVPMPPNRQSATTHAARISVIAG